MTTTFLSTHTHIKRELTNKQQRYTNQSKNDNAKKKEMDKAGNEIR